MWPASTPTAGIWEEMVAASCAARIVPAGLMEATLTLGYHPVSSYICISFPINLW